MLCPHCKDENLAMTDRQGIEIDYCPTCRGVWLDRGELDRLIERSERAVAAAPPLAVSTPPPPRAYDRDHDRDRNREQGRHHDDRYPPGHRHKKKSLLGELFDF